MPPPPDCIALITARAGSKRIPGKNIRQLGGKPLIAWSIMAALEARRVSRTIVSTDSAEIAEIARQAGAEVPFLRSPDLAGDLTPHYDVVAAALDWLETQEGRVPDLLCLLQPTTPLRTAADIDGTIELVLASQAESGVAVSQVREHPMLMYRLGPEAVAAPYLDPAGGYVRSQDMEPLYYINGAAYVLRPSSFRQRRSILSDNPVAYVMPPERSIDIDEEYDFGFAEAMMKAGKSMRGSA